ncbi:MAG: N-formylglutamate deformylase [Chloracidobacterium sp.]|uniref:N-formylglutamate deformylase n=1 Tax=Chloracidobacterium validum TaxID=2821543 RepID=A0ABX8BB36_9BACT|nr:N-formylglutamate deformylase [Chloracidobacterium validum]QUW02280.1 N-formylglutamate deformylase [Chloracidobacterium validum]
MSATTHAMTYDLEPGTTPLLISLPHVGTDVPPEIAADWTEAARALPDTDWRLETIYAFARELGAGILRAKVSRYVVDLNRPPDDQPLYPGARTTELCPTRMFDGQPIYQDGRAPDRAEVARRRAQYWQPYHDALSRELTRLQARYGQVILWEGHSIKSRLPWLFDGQLPDLNLGTADGQSCSPALRQALCAVLEAQTVFTYVVDGRFKGGYITRHYGRPDQGWQAVQLEMGWSCYMDEAPPYVPDAARLERLLPVLEALLRAALAWRSA